MILPRRIIIKVLRQGITPNIFPLMTGKLAFNSLKYG